LIDPTGGKLHRIVICKNIREEGDTMAKKKKLKRKATKKIAKKKVLAQKAKPIRRAAKAKAPKRAAARGKKRNTASRAAVDSVTSGSESSTLNPRGRLIVETEEEAVPGVHKGNMSGDLQGLSTTAYDDSESVSELIEEGQDLEAELIEGVEDAPEADQGDVRVHKAPQKDVPDYKDRNKI
jgi:hypothetical protein